MRVGKEITTDFSLTNEQRDLRLVMEANLTWRAVGVGDASSSFATFVRQRRPLSSVPHSPRCHTGHRHVPQRWRWLQSLQSERKVTSPSNKTTTKPWLQISLKLYSVYSWVLSASYARVHFLVLEGDIGVRTVGEKWLSNVHHQTYPTQTHDCRFPSSSVQCVRGCAILLIPDVVGKKWLSNIHNQT